MSKIFFITGASKGFGRHWAETALQYGHKVVATARKVETLSALTEEYGDRFLPISLDVNSRSASFAAIKLAADHFGRIDVLISNAGYGHFGFVEELTEDEARSQIETNLFGSLWVMQAVLPYMRAQQSGHIIQVSSIGGVIAFPNLGIYHASKWGIEGLCESLSKEVSSFGINITMLEPGPFTTDWSQSSAVRSEQHPDYVDVRTGFSAHTQTFDRGTPEATGKVLMKLVNMQSPPLRLMLGRMAWKVIEPAVNERLATWEQWTELADEAHE